MNSAILWMTHEWSDELCAQFDELCAIQCADAWILLDSRSEAAAEIQRQYPNCHTFWVEALMRLGYSTLMTNSLRGNAHLPVLEFYLQHRGYDFYWFIEYDVRYTAPWSSLFDLFSPFNHDFITTHLRWFRQEPRWWWWSTFRAPGQAIRPAGWIRSFNVIYRVSNNALSFLERGLRGGWQGHHEVLIATMLHHHQFKLLDFGGDGEFVQPGFRNRVYTSASNYTGDLGAGETTIRYRPARPSPGSLDHKLYHPVRASSVKGVDPTFEASR